MSNPTKSLSKLVGAGSACILTAGLLFGSDLPPLPELTVVPSHTNKPIVFTLAWNADDYASHILYQGMAPYAFTNQVQVYWPTNQADIAVDRHRNPYAETVYHFAVTSVDVWGDVGFESGFSAEVTWTNPPIKTNLVVQVFGTNGVMVWSATNPPGSRLWTNATIRSYWQ